VGIVEDLLRSGRYGDLVALCSTHTTMHGLCSAMAPGWMRDLAVLAGLADYGSDIIGPSDMPTFLTLAQGLAKHYAEERNLEARLSALRKPLDTLDVSDLSAFPKGVTLKDYALGIHARELDRLNELYLKDALHAMRGQRVYYYWAGPPRGRATLAFPSETRIGTLGLSNFGGVPVSTDRQRWTIPVEMSSQALGHLEQLGWKQFSGYDIAKEISAKTSTRLAPWGPEYPRDALYISALLRLSEKPLSSYTAKDIDALRRGIGSSGRGASWPALTQLVDAMQDAVSDAHWYGVL
jgi:hypothetical protein